MTLSKDQGNFGFSVHDPFKLYLTQTKIAFLETF